MIAGYLDTSALVKRYVQEAGSDLLTEILGQLDYFGTSILCQIEVLAALAKSHRTGVLSEHEAWEARSHFQAEWPSIFHVGLTESVMARAGHIAWDFGLKGYDATHLAASLVWRELLQEEVAMVTFDKQMWVAAERLGMACFPIDLPKFLEELKSPGS